MRPMTVEHERWEEFVTRLSGPEGCNFQRDANGKVTWKCAGGTDKSFALAALQQMGGDIDIPATLANFDEHGGHCDCEILFNVDRPCYPTDSLA